MKRVALITWSGLPEGAESEQLLASALTRQGVHALMIDWRDPSVDYGSFDLVVLRCCWDYHLHYDEFAVWMRDKASAVTVLNRIETVLWNSNKFYLRELQARGLEIAPTCFIAAGQEPGCRDAA